MERPGDVDHITLKVELKPGVDRSQVESSLKDQLRLKTNLGYDLQFSRTAACPGTSLKPGGSRI